MANNYKLNNPTTNRVFVKWLCLMLLLIGGVFSTNAQYTPVSLTGFNADVIANGTGPIAGSTTAAVDAVSNFFLDSTFRTPTNGAPTCYLPLSGAIASSLTFAVPYQLASYSASNSLRLTTASPSGTLTFTTPQNAGEVYVIGTGGSGAATNTITVNFSDATTQVFTGVVFNDWFGGAGAAIQGINRTTATTIDNGTTCTNNNPRIYEVRLSLLSSNYNKNITSVAITKTSTGGEIGHVFGVTLKAPCVVPADQATALVQGTTTTTTIDGSFTAAASTPNGYLVVGYLSGASPTAPVNGVTYTAGQLLGSGKVVSVGATTSFSAIGLTGGTAYDVYVYAYNSTACVGAPLYNTTSPLTGVMTTTACTGLAAGTYTVGPTGTYATLTAALATINAGISGPVILELEAAYTSGGETFPIVFPTNGCIGPVNTLIVRPEAAATALSITTNNAAGTIQFTSGSFITIDGRPGGSGTSNLTISNTNTGASPAIAFSGDAIFNTVQYCTVTSRNNSAASGTIAFLGGTTTGNDFNTIDNCTVSDDGGVVFPVVAIYSAGTSAAIDNTGNTVSNCNIANYFSATLATNGILLTSTGNNGWVISSNKLYQTANRVYTTANTHNGINIQSGSGYTVSNNIIGFANASGTGTTNMIGNSTAVTGTFPSAYTVTTTNANATRYIAINCAFTAGGTVSNIQGNTVAGFALYTSSGAGTTNGILCGINVTSGNANIGTVSGNTIGATSGNSSIYAINSTGGGAVVGIFVNSTNTVAIQNNNIGAIDAVGTSATFSGAFTGIDCGSGAGSYTISNNNIGNSTAGNIRVGYTLSGANLSNVGTLTSTTGTTSPLVGIRSTATGNSISITNNTLRGWIASCTAGAVVTGITSSGALTGTTPSVNVNNNFLGTASPGWMTHNVANAGALTGISVTNTVATTHSIQSNDIRGITYNVTGSGAHTYINITGATAANNITTVSNNTFTNLNVNTSGSITFIGHGYSAAATGTQNITNNSIVTAFNKGLAGGTITLAASNSSSAAGAVVNHANNNFSNITVTGATTIAGWNNTDGGAANKIFNTNTFSNWAGGTSAITVMTCNFGGGNGGSGNVLSGNIISGITGQGAITGIGLGTSGTIHTATGNSITGLSSTGTGGAVVGITSGAPNGSITNNTISTLSSTGASSVVTGIAVTGSTTGTTVSGNTINGISGTGATSPIANGITVSAGAAVHVTGNKIYDVAENGAIATTSGAVNGIAVSGGTTINVYNNLIGDLKAPAANLGDAIRGIAVTATGANTSYNVFYNTVYINATSSGTNFGSAGVFHSTNATATTAKLDLRNNIVLNISTPNGTGITSALRRSTAGVLGNYATTSNNNLLYAGTPGANNAILNDNGTVYGTAAASFAFGPGGTAGTFQNLVTPRETLSFTGEGFAYSVADTFFQSLTGSDPDFLHIVAGLSTLVEGGASPITTPNITTDYDGNTRNTTLPDVGADEFSGISPKPTITNVTVPTGGNCSSTAHVITADITTPSPSTISTVTLNYNNGAPGSVAMTFVSGDTYTGTIPGASPTNTNVTWNITAENSGGFIAVFNGTSYNDAVPLASNAVTITSSISSFCGVGGTTTLYANSNDTAYDYTWASLGTGTLSTTTGDSTDATVTETSNFTVTAIHDACSVTVATSIGVYTFPTVLPSAHRTTLCLGDTTTLISGVSSSNFTVSSATYALIALPGTETILCNNGTQTTALSTGTLDDGGWFNIPIGFNFNYFGVSNTTFNVSTNGNIQFGATGSFSTSFTPGSIPATATPNNFVALCWSDFLFTTQGSIRVFTTGIAPNRICVINYNGPFYNAGSPIGNMAGQIRLYETTGVVEIHLTQSNGLASTGGGVKSLGVENATGTIGAAAPGRNGTNWQTTIPEAWHFEPPHSYTFNWQPSAQIIGSNTLGNVLAQPTTQPQTVYSVLVTDIVNGCSATYYDTITVKDVPTAPSVNTSLTSVCAVSTAELIATRGDSTNVIQWFDVATGGSPIAIGDTLVTPVITDTTIFYAEEYNGACAGPRTAITVEWIAPPPITLTNSNPVLCGSGSISAVLEVSSPNDPNYIYTWTESISGTLDVLTGDSVNATTTETVDYTVTAVDTTTGCSTSDQTSISVFTFPAFTATADEDTICPGESVNLNAGVTAGNFSVASTPYLQIPLPGTETILCNNGTATTPLSIGSLDDGGWFNIPIGFTFNYFGDPNTTFNVSTNGNIQFGATGGFSTSFTPGIIPGTSAPNNFVALCWSDMQFGVTGSIRVFTTGSSPNRICVISYDGPFFGNVGTHMAGQIWLRETTGVVETHLTESNGVSTTAGGVKSLGVENIDGTVGAAAPGRNGSAWQTTIAEAWRFQPPVTYGFLWIPADGLNSDTVGTPVATPEATTTYYVLVTDPFTGCVKIDSVTIVVNPTPAAPSASNVTICGAQAATLIATGDPVLNWYADSTTSTILASGDTFVTPVISSDTSYYVSSTDLCEGPRTRVEITVTTPPAISASSNDTLICNGNPVTLSVSSSNPDYTYSWAPGAQTGTPVIENPTATTNYVVTALDTSGGAFNGCTITDTVTVFVQPASVSIVSSNPTICGSGVTTLTLNPASGYVLNSLQWQDSTSVSGMYANIVGETTPSYTTPVLTESTGYRVLLFDQHGAVCTSTTFEQPVYNPDILTTTPGSRCGTGTVSLEATANAGATITWYANATGGNPLATGSPFVTPVLSATDTFYVEASQGGAALSGLGNTTQPITTGALNQRGIVFDATTPFTLVSAQYFSPTTNVTQTATVVLQDNTGAQLQSAVLTIPQGASAAWYTMNLNFPVPAGTGYRLLAGFSSAVNRHTTGVDYSNAAFNNLSPVGVITSGFDVSPIATSYNYFHNIEVSYGCFSAREEVIATVTTPPAIVVSPPTTICQGDTTTLSATSVNDPNYTYTWTPGNLVGSSVQVAPSSTTTYTVTASDISGGAFDGCVEVGQVTITVNQKPSITSLTALDPILCVGDSTSIDLTVVPYISAVNYTLSTIPFAPVTPTGTVTTLVSGGVIVTPANGTSLDDNTWPNIALPFTFNFYGTPMTAISISTNGFITFDAASTATGCCSGQVLPSGTVPNNVVAMAWEDWNFSTAPQGTLDYYTEGTTPNQKFIIRAAGASRHNGTGAPTTAMIVLNESGTIEMHLESVTAGTGDLTTQGIENSSGTLATVVPGRNSTAWSAINEGWLFSPPVPTVLTYSWTPAAGLSSTSVEDPIAFPTTTTDYIVSVTETGTGCINTDTITITVAAYPEPFVTPGDSILCNGQEIFVHVNDAGPYSGGYPGGTTVNWLGIQNGLTPDDSVSSINGPYFIAEVTTSEGCVGTSDTVTIITRSINVSPVITPATCGNPTGSIVATVTSGFAPYHYIWTDGVDTLRDVTTSDANDSITGLLAGTYYLTIIDNIGMAVSGQPSCNSGQIPFTVLNSDGPDAFIASQTNVTCNGLTNGSVLVDASGGTPPYVYLWSTSETTPGISDLAAGTYTVTVTDDNGCSDTLIVIITEPDPIQINVNLTHVAVCGDSTGSATAIATGGTPGYLYEYFDKNLSSLGVASGDPTFNGLWADTFFVQVTDTNNCSNFIQFEITAPCNVTMNLKVYLEGYASFFGSPTLPMSAALYWQTVSASDADCDTVRVDLRDAMSSGTVIETAYAVIDTGGNAIVTFSNAVNGGTYWLAVIHRSSIETYSAVPITIGPSNTYYFNTSSGMAYFDNMKDLFGDGTAWAFYSGDIYDANVFDIGQDGFIDVFDYLLLDQDIQAGQSGYYVTDLNGDGFVDVFDYLMLDPNIQAGISKITPP